MIDLKDEGGLRRVIWTKIIFDVEEGFVSWKLGVSGFTSCYLDWVLCFT